jgi:hypothetical protein
MPRHPAALGLAAADRVEVDVLERRGQDPHLVHALAAGHEAGHDVRRVLPPAPA